MRRPLALSLLFAAVLAGCGGAAKVQAPNSRDRALLSSIVGGMNADLVSVRIGAPGGRWGKTAPGREFLYVTPKQTTSPARVQGDWYGMLIAGAYQSRCGGRAECLVGFQVAGGPGQRLGTNRLRPARVTSRSVARAIRSRFESHGFHVASISFERPWGLAPVVTVSSRNPQRTVTAYTRTSLLDHLPIEGALVRMLDARGNVFLIQAWSDRTHDSEGWTRPGLVVPGQEEGPTGREGSAGSGTAWPNPDARDRALFASILDGMKTNLRSAQLVSLPKQWHTARREGSLMVHTVPHVTTKVDVLGAWYTQLIAGSYNELCGRRADHCVAVEIADGTGGGGIGRTWAHRPYTGPRELARQIHRAFAGVHLPISSITFEHPNAYAPAITIRTSHPLRAYRVVHTALLKIPHRHIAGIYVQMFDAQGHLFWVSGGSGNNGEGWCAPFLHCPGA